ncbi:MAG: hypothetical protein RMY16_27175 [Nostoc sp. DedQUE12b]|uniref:hypothetical protein n=1 Tax=Nostoc sp. DedQUE12b TaxID=3075398 RepID=UPI002AD44295|nr:hypothetical protein [Nostoc sp. DedQUE12b]MDZ8089203.1 hypothetical protein [Nostoc sp. DedQUE12b]
MFNIDGFTPNALLQQMYGTQVLDEDVDLELSDEELELIANTPPECKKTSPIDICSRDSDVFVGDKEIISFSSIQQFVEKPERHQELIQYIRSRFQANGIRIDNEQVYGVIAENLRATAPIDTKRAHQGFKINLKTAQLCYLDTDCPF